MRVHPSKKQIEEIIKLTDDEFVFVLEHFQKRTLKISTTGNYSGESVKIYVAYIEIKKLLVSDAAEIFSETPIRTSTLEISALGAGSAILEINDIPTLFEIVKTGYWHTILSETSVNDTHVVGIPIEGKNMRRTIMIVSLKEAYEKKAVKKFYELLTKIQI